MNNLIPIHLEININISFQALPQYHSIFHGAHQTLALNISKNYQDASKSKQN